MPLQNRVAPNGDLHAVKARGTMLGNRGGKFHRDDQTLGKRRWASHHWIACELHYKNWHHEPMGQGYTSLFFLDEVTALSAGHRPCFMCRRKEAKEFLGEVSVDVFDRALHAERASRLAKVLAPQREGVPPHPEERPLGSLEALASAALNFAAPLLRQRLHPLPITHNQSLFLRPAPPLDFPFRINGIDNQFKVLGVNQPHGAAGMCVSLRITRRIVLLLPRLRHFMPRQARVKTAIRTSQNIYPSTAHRRKLSHPSRLARARTLG